LPAQLDQTDAFILDGGDAAASGSVHSPTGNVGLPEASAKGVMTDGSISFNGGFWVLLSEVQTPGAPTLAISMTSSNTAPVSWSSPSTCFNLQVNTNGVATVDWGKALAATHNATIKWIIVNPRTGNRSYKLNLQSP
jgi:hypothetical protein